MKKVTLIFMALALVLTGCGLNNVQEREVETIADEVYWDNVNTQRTRAIIAMTANEEVGAHFPAMFEAQVPKSAALDARFANYNAKITRTMFDAQTLRIPVFFTLDSWVLNDVARKQLTAKANIMNTHPEVALTIIGRASSKGKATHNLKLSKLRANQVHSYMVSQGVNPKRFLVTFRGQADSAAPLAEDQRVDFGVVVVPPGTGHPPPPEGPGVNPPGASIQPIDASTQIQ